MDERELFARFYKDICQEVINKAEMDDEEDFRENVFTRVMFEYLTEAGVIEDGNISYHEARGIKVNGFGISEDVTVITLFVCLYENNSELFTVPPSEVLTYFSRVKQFYLKSEQGYHKALEEAYDAFDISKTIFDLHSVIKTVNLIFFTNGTVRSMQIEDEILDDKVFTFAVWDLQRLSRVVSSGKSREPIDINLPELCGKSLNCLKVRIPSALRIVNEQETTTGGYTSYLTVIPGDVLFKIYEKYGVQLLEKNVRAFLQAKGGVNKGIRSTINGIPEMFLAYNNGISATASSLEIDNETANNCAIVGMKDFQIVNGGQTTASIFAACKRDIRPLNSIYVQAKITVLDDQDKMDEVVPKISEYANSQNKVQLADFSANHPFHVKIEELSRSVWAPAKTGGDQQTKWYFERARGQFADERSNTKNSKYFDKIYPKDQYFDKLELARFENVWDQMPYMTSKGGQAGFRDFMIRLRKKGNYIPDQNYYQNLIAKAILYRRIKEIVRKQNFLGFWANIADYTMSYLCYKSAQRIDLKRIWDTQNISDATIAASELVAHAVYDYIIQSSAGQNTSQWCKKEDCWKSLQKTDIPLPESFEREWVKVGNHTLTAIQNSIENMGGEKEKALVCNIASVAGQQWFEIAKWAKETSNLETYQRKIAFTLGTYTKTKKQPSYKQAKQALLMLREAANKGLINEGDYPWLSIYESWDEE